MRRTRRATELARQGQSDQRGVIYPVPTTQNNSASGTTGNTSGNEGLQDILLDEARGLVYMTNSGFAATDLDVIAPLLRTAADNQTFAKQLLTPVQPPH